MSLADSTALVLAATGAVGSEAARTLAREGAYVWLSGRDAGRLGALADEIRAQGGRAEAHVVDATDADAVQSYVDRIVKEAGEIGAAFNAVGLPPAELGYPARADDLDLDTFMRPVHIILGSTFLTTRTVGAQMARQGSGSIVTLSASLSGMAAPFMTALSATCGAVEAMTRAFAGEYGQAGVRVNCVRATAMPETRTIQETAAGSARLAGVPVETMTFPSTLIGRPITTADTARVVAFLASNASGGMTGQVVNVCGGQLLD